MTKAELARLKYETISFKNIITGGWALKSQASLVNKYNSYLFLLVDRASPRSGRAVYVSQLSSFLTQFLDSLRTHRTH